MLGNAFVYTPRLLIVAIGQELARCEDIFKNDEDPARSLIHGRLHIALRLLSVAIVDRPQTATIDEGIASLVTELFPEELISLIELQVISEFVKKGKEFAGRLTHRSEAAP
jgi:hypothetical protein